MHRAVTKTSELVMGTYKNLHTVSNKPVLLDCFYFELIILNSFRSTGTIIKTHVYGAQCIHSVMTSHVIEQIPCLEHLSLLYVEHIPNLEFHNIS